MLPTFSQSFCPIDLQLFIFTKHPALQFHVLLFVLPFMLKIYSWPKKNPKPPARRCKSTKQILPNSDGAATCLPALLLWKRPLVEDALIHAPAKDLHSLELFSGMAANTKGVSAQGLKAAGYDLTYNKDQDILTLDGLRCAVGLVVRVKPGGAVWAAP